MLSASSLSRSFDGVPAVEDLTFEVPSGTLFALLGPNGAGKTTTVRMLLGLIAPTRGTAQVAGLPLGRDERTNAAIRRACGLLTEAPGFHERESAWDNLQFFGRLYGIPEPRLAGVLERQLRAMGLWERRGERVGTYSKGMKQKLAIIRAVFHEPKIVFLDEPTAGLDPEAALAVRELIAGLKAEGRTILLCTHNLDEAERLADTVGVLRRRLLVVDALARLRGRSLVTVRLRAPLPGADALVRALPFAREVEVAADGDGQTLRTTIADAARDTPALVAAVVGAGGAVLEVAHAAERLESVYLRAVHGADASSTSAA